MTLSWKSLLALASIMPVPALAAPVSLSGIREPTVVSTPPMYAGVDLCRTQDGAIRHYGWQIDGGKKICVYIESKDEGLSWKTFAADPKDVGALVKSPWSEWWVGFTSHEEETLVFSRSKTGPGDTAAERIVLPQRNYACTSLISLPSRRRWLAGFVELTCKGDGGYGAAVAYSDDDGATWTFRDMPPVPGVRHRNPGSARDHWFSSGCEPTLVELKDGSVLMCVRTSGPHASFFKSMDGGATWGEPWQDTRFWQANTRPDFLRLSDGRLLFVWNNTQLLPEIDPALTPQGERGVAAFTNRDALHAAISDDDGATWRGFRELALSESRNACDWRELGNDDAQEKDKSVHQTQMLELGEGKVLVAYGQNSSTRRLAIFDPDWLMETEHKDNFQKGLANISHHLYLKSHSGPWRGWAGHCAWNRLSGAAMVLNPDVPMSNRGDVLWLGRIRDPRLVSDRAGIVWNFPASRRGTVLVNARIVGEGFRFTLADHWMNPCDETNPALSPISVPVTERELPCRKPLAKLQDWHDLTAEWDCEKGEVVLKVDGKPWRTEKMAWIPEAGFSYLHVQTLAEDADPDGTHFRLFSKTTK